MTDKKRKIGKLQVDVIWGWIIPVMITIIVYLIWIGSNIDNFPSDNARYFYSAVFQGFAALLALIITAILITLQNMNSQRYNIEERIYKILGKRFRTYIPGTIVEIKQDMSNALFNEEFTEYVKKNIELPLEKQELLVKRTTNELNGMFNYLDDLKKHKSDLRMFFALSALLSMLILFYSAIALILVDSDYILNVNHSHVLFLGLFLVMITIEIFVMYLFKIIKTWNISTSF